MLEREDVVTLRLNIGCGPYQERGYINIDKNPRQAPDLVLDVRKGLPYAQHSVDEILMSHFLEHLSGEEALDLLAECYRVLRPQALVTIVVPEKHPYCFDHLQTFELDSFDALVRPDMPDYYQRTFRWALVSKVLEPDSASTRQNIRVVLRAIP